ncbi:MAG: YqjK-like family protein [Betaproteobacteria bacterium]|jgi:hypothetical protein|nr:YqjK-like family protein [Betaproteobacteria bacterium]
MSSKIVELALKKQRLQLQAAAQRVRILHAIASASPAFGVADKARAAVGWAKANPEVLVATGVVLLVARPRVLFRWAKRGFFLWEGVRRLRGAVDSLLAPQ